MTFHACTFYKLITLTLLVVIFSHSQRASAHGGIPRVLKVIPPASSGEPLWVVDTLGAFRIDSRELDSDIDRRGWTWLCDDAVDPMLGVDDLSILGPQTLVAVAKSGFYRSEDEGCSFQRVESPINQHALGKLSVKPSDTSHIALFTDSVGQDNSVWWSRDAGLTWRHSDLTIEGSIYAMWRDPLREDDLWLNHARGLSYSQDGGQSFQSIDPMGYGMNAAPTEARLLGGGYLNGQLALFVGINRFPTASLLLSLDRGETWRVIYELEDSFESLLLTENSLWVSSPFEGLSRYLLGNEERANSPRAWQSLWLRDQEAFIGCLREDPLIPGKVWGCGRISPTPWIIGYTEEASSSPRPTWRVMMNDYGEAAGGDWGCSPESQSVLACLNRCLDEGCDPSGLEMRPGEEQSMPSSGGNEDVRSPTSPYTNETERDAARGENASSDQGCSQVGRSAQSAVQLGVFMSLAIFMTWLLLVRLQRAS